MSRKVKFNAGAAGIVGLVFSILGAIYLLIGILCLCFPEDADDQTVGIIFSIIAIVCLLSALVALLVLIYKQSQTQKILDNGKYLLGEVVDIVPNLYMHYGFRPTYLVLTRYIDQKGTIHIFRSENIKTYPDRTLLGRKVKIYYQDDNFQHYYVDLESGFPKIIEH